MFQTVQVVSILQVTNNELSVSHQSKEVNGAAESALLYHNNNNNEQKKRERTDYGVHL